MISPKKAIQLHPNKSKDFVSKSRKQISNILNGKDNRLVIFLGPCSIHNYSETLEYARKVRELSKRVDKKILLVMRTYLEKPRSTVGWKGLINDIGRDEKFNLNKGIIESRKLLSEINKLNVPCVTEFLNPNLAIYFQDLISCGTIGARTTESQIHREFVSNLNFPVGFKNNLEGDFLTAINSIIASSKKSSYVGIDLNGQVTQKITKGNKNCFLILRGGKNPNCYEKDIIEVKKELLKNKIKTGIVVDCSHGNSKKDFKNQGKIFDDVINQIKNGNKSVKGLMLESYLIEGKQNISNNLKKGISITDSCIGWEETEKLILSCC